MEAEIGEAVDLVIHVEREPGRRVIREVLRLNGYDRGSQTFQTEYVYQGASRTIAELKPC